MENVAREQHSIHFARDGELQHFLERSERVGAADRVALEEPQVVVGRDQDAKDVLLAGPATVRGHEERRFVERTDTRWGTVHREKLCTVMVKFKVAKSSWRAL